MEDIVIENFNVFVIVGANKLISRYFLIFFSLLNAIYLMDTSENILNKW